MLHTSTPCPAPLPLPATACSLARMPQALVLGKGLPPQPCHMALLSGPHLFLCCLDTSVPGLG